MITNDEVDQMVQRLAASRSMVEALARRLRDDLAWFDDATAQLRLMHTEPALRATREEAERQRTESAAAADRNDGLVAGQAFAKTMPLTDLHFFSEAEREHATTSTRSILTEKMRLWVNAALPRGFGSSAISRPAFVSGFTAALRDAAKARG